MALVAVPPDDRAGPELVVLADRLVEFPQLGAGLSRGDAFQLLPGRERLPFMTAVAAVLGPAVALGHVRGRQDQAGRLVAHAADAGDVPPGVHRVRGVDAR